MTEPGSSQPDLGIELIIEPDVVPAGTVDVRSFDAPPGTPAPDVRVTSEGQVVPRERPSKILGPLHPRVKRGEAELAFSSQAPTAAPVHDRDTHIADPRLASRVDDTRVEPGAETWDEPDSSHQIVELVDSAVSTRPDVLTAGVLSGDDVGLDSDSGEQIGLEVTGARSERHESTQAHSAFQSPSEARLEERLRGVPDLPAETPEGESPTLAALQAAVTAPLPARPAAADDDVESPTTLVGVGAPAPYEEEFDTDLDGGALSTAFTLTQVLLYLILLTSGVGALGLHLAGIAPWQEKAEDLAAAPDPHTVPLDPPADPDADPAPVDPDPAPEDPDPKPTPPPKPTPEDVPEDPDPVDPPQGEPDPPLPDVGGEVSIGPADDPPPEDPDAPPTDLELMAMRLLAEGTGVGAEVGVEEDEPGLLSRVEGLRARAARLLADGDPDGALAALQELLELTPGDADALFRVGRVYHQKGDLDAALASYQGSAERAPHDPRPWNNQGVIHIARGDDLAARDAINKALSVAPEHPDALANLGLLTERDDPDQAVGLYMRALATDPSHGPARLGRGRSYQRLGNIEAARADYQALVEAESPLSAQALDALGTVEREAGQPAQAAAYHRRALLADPRLGTARLNLGVALMALEADGEALEHLVIATRLMPESARAFQALGMIKARLASSRPYLLNEAKEAYEESLRLDDSDWVTHYNYALCAERFGNFLFAMREYERALELEPRSWPAAANLSRLYRRGDNNDRALGYLDLAIRLAPDEPDLHLHRAYLLAQLDRTTEAQGSLRRFVELADETDPRLDAARRGLGER
jgi:tetratricopeptide (TPR) repeat protein